MKKNLLRPIALLSALTLVLASFSCAIWTGGSESGTITMSFAPTSKALGEGATEARVWVYSNNVLVPNPANSDGYYSTTVDSTAAGTITIKDLPPGDNYRIVAAAFKTEGTTSTITSFGTSSLFSIKPGVETAVTIELNLITIPAKSGTSLKSVVAIGGQIYAAGNNGIYYGSNVSDFNSWRYDSLPSGSINSLNLTADDTPRVLVNTSQGVSILGDNGIVSIGTWKETPPSVLQSGGMVSANTFFYQADKELGGIVGSNEPGKTWNQIELNIEALTGRPILDLLIIRKDADTFYGYFATRVVGAFKVGSRDIETIELKDILEKKTGAPIQFFGEDIPMIQAFGYIEKETTKTLYVGTKNGVYYTSDIDNLKSFSLLEGTKGLDVSKVVVEGDNEAFLTSKEIVILKGGTKVYKMPFLTSVIGTLTDISWNVTDLIVTGTNGICSIPTDQLK